MKMLTVKCKLKQKRTILLGLCSYFPTIIWKLEPAHPEEGLFFPSFSKPDSAMLSVLGLSAPVTNPRSLITIINN